MNKKEIRYKIRLEIPKPNGAASYDYEELELTAELQEGDDVNVAFSELRKNCISNSTKFKREQKAKASA